MKNLRHILVAIKDTKARSQPALRKAAQLAAGSGARLTLFHALATPLYLDAYNVAGMTLQQTQKQWRERTLTQLEKIAAPLRRAGLTVATEAEWDFPAYEAVIREVQQCGAELIVAERHATRHLLPSLLRFNDWELLRRSPVPVLLIKRSSKWLRPVVLAAIDPVHNYAKPAKLDMAIMNAANQVASALSGKLHIAYAWCSPLLSGAHLSALEPDMAVLLDRRARQAAQATFRDEIDKAGLSKARRHFVDGLPVDTIRKLTRREHAGIVVMGAVSRSGLQRLVLGNVAEEVLDVLPCDVLVVKPAGFKARVRRNGRGVQLIPTPSYT